MRWLRTWRKPLAARLPTETIPRSLPGTSVPSFDVEKVSLPLIASPGTSLYAEYWTTLKSSPLTRPCSSPATQPAG